MKTRNKIRTARVVTPPRARISGSPSLSGPGTSPSPWAIPSHPTPMRTTEFAAALAEPVAEQGGAAQPDVSYKPPVWAISQMGCLAGEHFTPQPDGTLQCPAGFPLYPQERRLECDSSVRVVYAARIGHCRPCSMREECQGYG